MDRVRPAPTRATGWLRGVKRPAIDRQSSVNRSLIPRVRPDTTGTSPIGGSTPFGAGERVEALAGHTKCLALLVYLAVEVPDGRAPRDAMAALLWPDRPDDRARASLRGALTQIRKATDPVLLVGEGSSSLGLARDRVWADVIAFEEAVAAGEEELGMAAPRSSGSGSRS